MTSPFRFTPDDARAQFPADASAMRFAYVLKHGTMKLGLYAQTDEDRQQPHAQDELYFVASGSADLFSISGAFLSGSVMRKYPLP